MAANSLPTWITIATQNGGRRGALLNGDTQLMLSMKELPMANEATGPGWENICRDCFGSMVEWPGMSMCNCTHARPKPGSYEASLAGCRCPVMDNCYGRGWRGQPGVFVFSADCPVHNGVAPKDWRPV
jgi:hypothetical protein